jgi:hypothetical protein
MATATRLEHFVMPDPIIEQLLRRELINNSQRWSKTYDAMDDEQRQDILGNLTARRLVSEERNRAMQMKEEPEEREYGEGVGTLQCGIGGGRRVIRSSNTFS